MSQEIRFTRRIKPFHPCDLQWNVGEIGYNWMEEREIPPTEFVPMKGIGEFVQEIVYFSNNFVLQKFLASIGIASNENCEPVKVTMDQLGEIVAFLTISS